MDVNILVTKPKTLMRKDKDLLRASGVIVIEAEDPKAVRFLRPEADIEYGDMLYAAITAVNNAKPGHGAKEIFAETLGRIINGMRDDKEGKKP